MSDETPVGLPTTRRPRTALRVADLTRSLRFYVDLLGLRLEGEDPARDLAWLDAAGYPALLAGPRAGDDLSALLSPDDDVLSPPGTLHVLGVDLDALRERLAALGTGAEMVERPWGDRTLGLIDPDGYRVVFESPAKWSPAEAVRHYAAGADALADAVAGLDDAGLDARPEPGGWTVRQIVHHLADVEALTFPVLLAALAEPGRQWLGNPWSPDRWAVALDYANRPMAPSLALFRATRAVVLDLLDRFPERSQQATRRADGTAHSTVAALVGMLAGHALEHVEEIRAARQLMER